jgi:C4-dicarboxylate-specific signal transduction histidine kinase
MFYELTRQAVKKFAEDKQIRYILDVSMDEALSRLNDLPDSSLLFMPFFVTDDKQVTYFNPESARLFSNASRVPLFVYTEVGLGEGAFGGYVISFTKAGRIAGEAAIRIMKGEDPSSIKFSPEDYYHYAFDWRQMQRWQVSRSRLPQDYTILNRENDFLDRFMWLIITGILFLILQTILIFRLIILNRKYKMMTVQLRETESKFRDLVREDRVLRIGQLTASLSHELNQPLTAILSTAQAGIRFIDSNNADPQLLREILQNIVEDDKRTAAILSSIRGMMKLEKREMEKTNLNDLIQEMVIIFNTEAVAQKLKLEMKLTDEPVFVKADPIQIQQVIHNLMSNALQAMGKVISDNKKITITEIKAGDEVVVSVRDYGQGIDERITPKIFIPFVTTKKEGLGIGLAISRSIIDDHRGRIWAENKPDGGAEFSFSLKILKDEK